MREYIIKHSLYDSWFASPKTLAATKGTGCGAIAMIKKLPTFLFGYQGENLSLTEIYKRNRKRRGRSKYLLSVEVTVNSDGKSVLAKAVFVRNRNRKKEYLCLISTDTSLAEIEEKTNEIPAAQEVLRLMDLEGTAMTADAMNCQKDTAAAVIDAGGDYVLALKGNQQLFYEEVKGYFDEGMLKGLRTESGNYRKTVGKEHDGTAVREYYITEDILWFSEKKRKKLKSIGMVHKALKKQDERQAEEYGYYIYSINADAEDFERAARGRWGVENCLHWQLDFTFGDDKNRSMAKTCRL